MLFSTFGTGAGKGCLPPLSVFASLCWDDRLFGFGRSKPLTETPGPGWDQRNGEYGGHSPLVSPSLTCLFIDCWRSLILRLRFYIDANLYRGGEGGDPKSHQGEFSANARSSSFFDIFLWRIPTLVPSSNLYFFSLI